MISFSEGFLQGIETNSASPSVCVTSIENFAIEGASIIDDFISFTEGVPGAFTNFVLALQKYESYVTPLKTQCSFAGLSKRLALILSPAGIDILLKNYMKNIKVLSQDFQTVSDCSMNYHACGLSAGNAFKLLVGWSLNSLPAEERINSYEAEYLAFLEGIIKGLQTNPTEISKCFTEFDTFFLAFQALGLDIKKVIEGDTKEIANLYKDFSNILDNVPEPYVACNISQLIKQINELLGSEGLTTLFHNYQNNKSTIMADVANIMDCKNNFSTCGLSIGNAIKNLIGWSY